MGRRVGPASTAAVLLIMLVAHTKPVLSGPTIFGKTEPLSTTSMGGSGTTTGPWASGMLERKLSELSSASSELAVWIIIIILFNRNGNLSQPGIMLPALTDNRTECLLYSTDLDYGFTHVRRADQQVARRLHSISVVFEFSGRSFQNEVPGSVWSHSSAEATLRGTARDLFQPVMPQVAA